MGTVVLNALQGGIVDGAANVPAGADGGIQVMASDDCDLVIDMNGYYAVASTFEGPPGPSGPQGAAAQPVPPDPRARPGLPAPCLDRPARRVPLARWVPQVHREPRARLERREQRASPGQRVRWEPPASV